MHSSRVFCKKANIKRIYNVWIRMLMLESAGVTRNSTVNKMVWAT
jgi:hypothetical protein